jgi:hypothetical protein
MSRTPLLRAAATFAGVAAVLLSAATPALAAKKVPTTQVPRITSGPANGSFQPTRTATFAFNDAVANATLTCKLDNGTAGVCKSPKTYTRLTDGSHTFSVTATAPGKKASSPAARTWTVDLHVPVAPTVSTSQSSPTNQTTRPFTFVGETGATFQCSVDGGSFGACSTPYTTPQVGSGGHVLAVKQVARNTLSSPATSVGWDVDTTKPDAPVINSGPTGTVSSSNSTFTFTFSDPTSDAATFVCRLSTSGAPGNESDCSSGSYMTTTLADGSYVFHLFSKDLAGNQSSEATQSFTVDHTAPAPPVLSGQPPVVTNQNTATFTVPPGSTCTLDGNTVDCSVSPYTTPVLGDGQHTFTVSNGTTSTSYTWTIDTTAPVAPTFVDGPANGSTTSATSGVIGLNSDGSSTLTCKLDGSATACPGFVQLSNLANGGHTLVVTATDAAGNTTAATRSWTVDTIAPRASITAPASLTAPAAVAFGEAVRATHATVATLVLTDSGQVVPSAQRCLTGSTVVSCSSAAFRIVHLTPAHALTSGQHYSVRVAAGAARDAASNANAAASKSFRALRVLQETVPGVAQAWQRVSSSSALGGSYVREHLAGARAAWSFTGTSVTWWTVTGPAQGRAYLYVDGVRRAVDNYAAKSHFHVARTVGKLPNKSHRALIVVRGLRGATAGTGTFVSVDGFTVGSTTTASPALSTAWRHVVSKSYSGGAASIADLRGSALRLTFRGTAISWVTARGPRQGKAQVWIDGVLKTTVDNYAATASFGVKRTVTKLADKVHTLRIVVLGRHHAGARCNTVTVDRFAVT